ncbi:MAG: SDR family oxidoreductase [Anaerolineales bacterium]|nr:SDR family oxidoreductase [Anaerolineales bacterium]
MKSEPFSNQVVIITGASSGIGEEMALQLAAQHARLVLAARRSDLLENVAARCRETGAEVLVLPTDVSDPAQCKQLIEQTLTHFGRIDTLINNAGFSIICPFDELTDLTGYEQMMAVNYLGSLYCTYHALPALKQSRGRIVAIASAAGKLGVPTRSGYSASKQAMAGFFDALRIELTGAGVSVTIIYPGFVATRGRVPGGMVMLVETCARQILRAVTRRRRELVMTPLIKTAVALKTIFPALLDRVLARLLLRDSKLRRQGNPPE